MSDDKLAEIEAELARQDGAFEEVKAGLSAFGDTSLEIPQAFFDELDAIAEAPRPATTPMPIHGIRA